VGKGLGRPSEVMKIEIDCSTIKNNATNKEKQDEDEEN
jgi:hypothetical protein